jgi:hypothetical protein
MPCVLCQVRRPRRACPGVGGDICSLCCGTEREQTVNCPLDCPYLREARSHEKPVPLNAKDLPNADIPVDEPFLQRNEILLAALMHAVAEAGLATAGAVDSDVREALESLVRTYRTRESGLYYETRPSNLIAAAVLDLIHKSIEDFRQALAKRSGMETLRDTDILGVLVFLENVEYQMDNGRKRGRAFLDMLREQSAALAPSTDAPGSSLVLP